MGNMEKLSNVLGQYWAEHIGRKVRACCPRCHQPLKITHTIPADFEVFDNELWNQETGQWEPEKRYKTGKMVSQLKDLKTEDPWGEMNIYCPCGWFSEERTGEGFSPKA